MAVIFCPMPSDEKKFDVFAEKVCIFIKITFNLSVEIKMIAFYPKMGLRMLD